MMLPAADSSARRILRRVFRLAVGSAVIALSLGVTVAVQAPNFARRAAGGAGRVSASPAASGTGRTLGVRAASSATAPTMSAALAVELLHDIVPADTRLTFALVVADPATDTPRPRVPGGPAIRGLYTGAAKSRVLWMEVTAYCPCTVCCGPNAQGITASGKAVDYAGGHFVAADGELFAFGTRLRIPTYFSAQPVEVVDRGSAIKGHRLDVFFPTHDEAALWGRKWLPVSVEGEK